MHAFDVLGDPVRRRILELLADGEMTSGAVCAVIQAEFGISQPGVSQHLRVLREAGFATVRPEGAQLQGNASGTIERCDPPASFAATWEFGGQVSWIEVQLMARPEGGTQLVLEHIAHVNDEQWAEFGPGAVGIGWDMGFMGLAVHLSSGQSMDPREGMAWATSAEGKEFMLLASQRWCDASVAAGTDEAAARAAAGRTTAAYTATGA